MIRLDHVSKLYPSRAEAPGGMIRALDDFTLRVEPGEWIAVMGPSGSGKSTLVNLIGCLDRPTSGEIWLDAQNVAALNRNELNRVRAEKIGFIRIGWEKRQTPLGFPYYYNRATKQRTFLKPQVLQFFFPICCMRSIIDTYAGNTIASDEN